MITPGASNDFEVVVEAAKRLIPLRSIEKGSGGEGEKAKADELCKILTELGFSNFNRFDVTDAAGSVRSNVVVKIGNHQKTLWIIAHIDTVPEGSLDLWTKPPFSATLSGNKIYGRGTADNGEGIFSSLLLLKRLKRDKMRFNLGIAFVADEETGSKYGIQLLMSKGLFQEDDLIIVPDSGTPEGLDVEVAEKSILWLKFTVTGKQGHGSRPDEAVNAGKEAMSFALGLDRAMHEKFNATDNAFEYPVSSFEITKHEKNVDNVNTIPGIDVFYMDNRILPQYDIDQVLDFVREKASEYEKHSKARIKVDIVQKEQAPPRTSPDSEVYVELKNAIVQVLGGEPKAIGIGGGTCAAFFRRNGINAVVWGISEPEVYHQPDEYVVVDYVIRATDVLEKILYG